MKWTKAQKPVLDLMKEIVENMHDRLSGANIAVIMWEKSGKSNGRASLACAAKMPPKMNALFNAKFDFLIWVAQDWWVMASSKQKRAVLDHELCHCEMDPEGEPQIRPHDLEEFGAIIARYGFWREDMGEARIQAGLIQGELMPMPPKAAAAIAALNVGDGAESPDVDAIADPSK